MTTTQMNTYLTAAKRLSFSTAAKELFISQSAVSRQIQAMEQEIGTQLFIRDGNAIRLTLAGQILREELERTQLEFYALREQLKLLDQGKVGIFRFGLLENQALIPPLEAALQALQTGTRQITIERMTKKQLHSELCAGRLDAACMTAENGDDFSGSDRLVIARESRCVAAAKRLHFGAVDSPKELFHRCQTLRVPLVDLDESLTDKPLRRGLSSGRKAAFDPSLGISAMNLRTLEPTVSSGFAVTCVNETNRLSLDNKIELIELPFFPKEEKILLWPQKPENPLCPEFLAFVYASLGKAWPPVKR